MERLLVVDDEPTVRELLSATLRFAGFEVSSAATGAEAVEAVRRAAARPGPARRDAARPGRVPGRPPALRELAGRRCRCCS